jgi:ABC-2 type transport system ATP-binding protein
MLEFIAVNKSFNGVQVLQIPQWRLSHGMYWLQGANGSGKSTLLKIMAGLLPFSGDIRLNDSITLQKQPVAFRKQINYAPAEPQFPPFITGLELVNFTQSIKKGDQQQITTVREVLQIGDFINNPTGSYSSGMLKKLFLLLAFIGRPQWILLDEPFTTLDHASQQALEQLIVTTHQQKNISFILTSHHDIEASHIPFHQVFRINNQELTVVNNLHEQ